MDWSPTIVLTHSESNANAVRELRPILVNGLRNSGVARIRVAWNAPTYSIQALSNFVRAVSESLGVLLPQSYRNQRISLIRDSGGNYGSHTARGHETSAALAFHSDRADISILLYVRSALVGGQVSVVSYEEAATRLADMDASSFRILMHDLPFDLREERLFEEPRWLLHPVFWQTKRGIRGYYIRRFITDSQRHGDCPRLSGEQQQALDAFDAILETLRKPRTFAPQSGDLLVLDNYRVMHAREAFVGGPRNEGRLAIRAWVSPFESDTLPGFMLPAVGALQGGCIRGGVSRAKRFRDMLGRIPNLQKEFHK
jgi:hypothetical protein